MTPAEHDLELVALTAERADLLRRHERGEAGLADLIDNLADCINYTNGVWNRYRWPRYFRPHEGAIHERPLCRGMRQPAPLVPALSGISDLAVVRGHGPTCRHCLPGQ
jgi:hypothetical protein